MAGQARPKGEVHATIPDTGTADFRVDPIIGYMSNRPRSPGASELGGAVDIQQMRPVAQPAPAVACRTASLQIGNKTRLLLMPS
jgi:hypothetical protein